MRIPKSYKLNLRVRFPNFFQVLGMVFAVVPALLFLVGFLAVMNNNAQAQTACTGHDILGYAWSENIGWISFSCENDSPSVDYGVDIDENYNLTGYAWSENIGWIRMDPNGPFPDSPSYTACLDMIGVTGEEECDGVGEGTLSGWARACAGAIDTAGCAETFSEFSEVAADYPELDDKYFAMDGDYTYTAITTTGGEWRVERRNLKDGSLAADADWVGGVLQFSPGGNPGVLKGIALDNDSLYVVGSSNSDWWVERRDKATGAHMWSKGERVNDTDDGIIGTSGRAKEVVVSGNDVFVMGSDETTRWRVQKYAKTDGSFDTSFEADGAVVFDFDGYPQSLAEEGDSLYVGGYEAVVSGMACKDADCGWRIERVLKSNGSSVWTQTSVPGGDPYLLDLTVDGSTLFAAGRVESPSEYAWRVEKRNISDGTPIGSVEENISSMSDYLFDIDYDADFLYLIGTQNYDGNGNGNTNEWRIEKRSKDTLALDEDFGTNGIIDIDFNSSGPQQWGLGIIEEDGYIYTAGVASVSGEMRWVVEKRDAGNGGLNWIEGLSYPDSDWDQAAVFASHPEAGGWDGWISLAGGSYGVTYDFLKNEFQDWAWGGEVLGWISFSCDNDHDLSDPDVQTCDPSNEDERYHVEPAVPLNPAPEATNLSETELYCNSISAPIIVDWDFVDAPWDSQGKYQVQVDLDNDWSDAPTIDSCDSTPDANPDDPLDSGTCNGSSSTSYTPPGGWTYGITNYWRVRVWDSYGVVSDWEEGQINLPIHHYPKVDFEWTPPRPSISDLIQFDDQTVFGGGPGSLQWDFDNDGTYEESGSPVFQAYSSTGTKPVTLFAEDSVGSCSVTKSVFLGAIPPLWREVPPN